MRPSGLKRWCKAPGRAGACTRPCGRGGLATSDGWCNAPPMSSEEIPPAPSPPNGEDCALLHSFLLSPPQPLRWVAAGAPIFLPEENEKTGRARSKRVKEVGTRRTGARLNDRRSRNDFPRDFRLSGGLSDDESTSSSFRWRYPVVESAKQKPKAPSLRELSPPEAVTEGVPP